MARQYHRLLLLFVDGVGLAPAGLDNPLATEEAPTLEALLGGPLVSESAAVGSSHILQPLDACLGVCGLPQSATGQATLFTGVNAAARMERHVTGLPGPQLRDLVHRKGLFLKAAKAGRRATFANAYSREYLDRLRAGEVRPSVTTCVAQAAGVPLRTVADLEAGQALTWDVVGDLFGTRSAIEVERTEPRVAGRRLAALATSYDLTVYETFLPDLAGHGRVKIEGILEAASKGVTLLLTSDHGNFESRRVRGHTRNPVPLLAVGPAAGRFRGLSSLQEITPRILQLLRGAGWS
jgi:hypothetical protein